MFTINSFSVLGMNVEEDFLSFIFSLLCRKCIFEASQETLNYTIDSRRLHKPPSRITFSVRSLNTKLDVNMFLPFFSTTHDEECVGWIFIDCGKSDLER